MANPQLEDGYTRIVNEILEAIIHFPFTAAQYKIVFALIRKTWGYQKKEDWISHRQFAEMADLNIRTVQRELKRLKAMNVIQETKLVKDFDKWKTIGLQTDGQETIGIQTDRSRCREGVGFQTDHKRNITKENNNTPNGEIPAKRKFRSHPYLSKFCSLYQEIHSTDYIIGEYSAEGGAAKTVASKVPDESLFEKAVRAYLGCRDEFFVERRWPFLLFVKQLNRWVQVAKSEPKKRHWTDYVTRKELLNVDT